MSDVDGVLNIGATIVAAMTCDGNVNALAMIEEIKQRRMRAVEAQARCNRSGAHEGGTSYEQQAGACE